MKPAAAPASAICADLAALSPAFRAGVERLLEQLRFAGYEPVVHETYRTPERAAMLAVGGTGIALSMHCLRIAADVICARHAYNCGRVNCDFYQRLGSTAERLGMTWGGRFERRDLDHVQGVPVAAQHAARRATPLELEQLVAEYVWPGGH